MQRVLQPFGGGLHKRAFNIAVDDRSAIMTALLNGEVPGTSLGGGPR